MNKERLIGHIEGVLQQYYQENKDDGALLREREEEVKTLEKKIIERNGKIISLLSLLSAIRNGAFEDGSTDKSSS